MSRKPFQKNPSDAESFVQALGLLLVDRQFLSGDGVREEAQGSRELARQLFFQKEAFAADHGIERWDELLGSLAALHRFDDRLEAHFNDGSQIETRWPHPPDEPEQRD